MRDELTYCRICNAMCGIVVTIDDADGYERVASVRGDPLHPLSRGYVCPKGRAAGAFHHHERRLDVPLVRRCGQHVAGAWPEVLDELAATLRSIVDEHGPDAVGMYLASGSAFDVNGRRAAERFLHVLGSRQKYTATTIDTPCKPLVAELIGGWSGLTPIWDHERSSLLVLLGSNPVVSHGHSNAIPDPVRRLREHRARGGTLVVVDPRHTETAALADVHLAPRPGTDAALLGHLVRELLLDGADRAHLEAHATGVETLRAAVERFDSQTTQHITGLDGAQLDQLLGLVRRAGRVSALTGTGNSMHEHANTTEWLLWALHIVTGSYDQPGGMWFNPGYLLQLDTRTWQASDGRPEPGPASRPELPRRFGEHPCAGLLSELEHGNLRALIVVGGNPLTALPQPDRLAATMRSLECCVVVDVVTTETTAVASHVLPATGQLERGDVPWLLDAYQLAVATQRTPAILQPVAERKPVWWMFQQLAQRLGTSVLPRGVDPDTVDDEALLDALCASSRDGIDTVRAARHGLVGSGAVFGWVTERVLDGGRWRLAPAPLVDQLDRAFRARPAGNELVLVAMRQLRTMNSQLRDTAAPGGRTDRAGVRMHPSDAQRIGVADGEGVRVRSRHGALDGEVELDPRLAPSTVAIPHGWSSPNVSQLTSSEVEVDPLTGMVRQGALAVTIEPLPVAPPRDGHAAR